MFLQRRIFAKILIVFIISNFHFVACKTCKNETIKNQLLLKPKNVETIESSLLNFCASWTAITAFGTALAYLLYYCNKQRARFNILRQRLMMSKKMNLILQYEGNLMHTKLTKFQLDTVNFENLVSTLQENLRKENDNNLKLLEQISSLEQDLANATEAGLELHHYVLKLVDNNKSEETLTDSVKSVQQQLRTHNQLMYEIKNQLFNRDKSEFQLSLMAQSRRMDTEYTLLKELRSELNTEKLNYQKRIEDIRADFEFKSSNMCRQNESLKRELFEVQSKNEMNQNELQISLAKIEILEDSIKTLKSNREVELSELLNSVNLRAELLVKERDYMTQQSYLVEALEANKQSDQNLRNSFEQVKCLNLELEVSNKEKIEAQIGLSTLKSLFKDKEAQMQKEIVEKSLTCLKQQDEINELRNKILNMLKDAESQKNVNFAPSFILPPPFIMPYIGDGTSHPTSLASSRTCCEYSESSSPASSINVPYISELESEQSQAETLQWSSRSSPLRCKRQLFRTKSKSDKFLESIPNCDQNTMLSSCNTPAAWPAKELD